MDKTGQLEIFDILLKDVPEEVVKITGAINVKTSPISEHEVFLAYGDLTLIIAVLRDYVKGLDQMLLENRLPVNEIEYEAYYRKKFLDIANKISEQIEYDYDKKREQCIKKMEKADKSDIGEEALSLALKR